MFRKLSQWISTAWVRWLNQERPHEGVPLCDFERIRYELRPCDVLLIEGRSRVSDIIRSISQSSWSHAALYLGRLHDIEDPEIRDLISEHYNGAPDTQLIIEGIMGKGAIISALSIYEFDHIRVCRPRGLSRQDAQRIIGHAALKLGNEYDIRQVIDLARFMLPWRMFPRRFRSKLFMEHAGDNTKIVCSTMIAEAFASVEFPILPLVKRHDTKGYELITRNPKLYSPRDFDYSPYFDIMKYPYIEFVDYAQYRKLPWNREGLISHDRVGVHATKFKIANPQTDINKIDINDPNAITDANIINNANAINNTNAINNANAINDVNTINDTNAINDTNINHNTNESNAKNDQYNGQITDSSNIIEPCSGFVEDPFTSDSYLAELEKRALEPDITSAAGPSVAKKKPVETPPSP